MGTLAAYGRAGDQYRIYELNPQVLELARTHFTYLSQSPAAIAVQLGDDHAPEPAPAPHPEATPTAPTVRSPD